MCVYLNIFVIYRYTYIYIHIDIYIIYIIGVYIHMKVTSNNVKSILEIIKTTYPLRTATGNLLYSPVLPPFYSVQSIYCCSIVTFIILCHNVCSPMLFLTKFLNCLIDLFLLFDL